MNFFMGGTSVSCEIFGGGERDYQTDTTENNACYANKAPFKKINPGIVYFGLLWMPWRIIDIDSVTFAIFIKITTDIRIEN